MAKPISPRNLVTNSNRPSPDFTGATPGRPGRPSGRRCGDPPHPERTAQTQERCFLFTYGNKPKQSESSPTITLTLQHTFVIGLKSSHDLTITQSTINKSGPLRVRTTKEGEGVYPFM